MIFDEIINSIENDDMKEFAIELIKTIPKYFYDVGASSTGKYHPLYALGSGGLARHTLALVRFLNHTFEVECMNDFTSRERDMLRIAAMMHDTRKSGNQDDFEKNKYTNFDHPLQAATVIRSFDSKYLTHDEIQTIAKMIESHMGQWNTDKRSSIVLPKPETKLEKWLHYVDYLASRKDLEVKFDFETQKDSAPADVTPDTWTFFFGKHKGQSLKDVSTNDPSYITWLVEKSDLGKEEPLKSLLGALKN